MGRKRAEVKANGKSQGRKWFSLIELLVVIGIISILAALLLPALKSAKDTVNLITCKNNLRQAALAGKMYADDFDDCPPPGPTFSGLKTGLRGDTETALIALAKYYGINVKDGASAQTAFQKSKVLWCPSAYLISPTYGTGSASNAGSLTVSCYYAQRFGETNLKRVKTPSLSAWVFDAGTLRTSAPWTGCWATNLGVGLGSSGPPGFCHFRRGAISGGWVWDSSWDCYVGTENVLFFDGHVEDISNYDLSSKVTPVDKTFWCDWR